jgi:putative membrane protein
MQWTDFLSEPAGCPLRVAKPLSSAATAGAPNPGLAEMMGAQRNDMAAQRTELAYQRNRFAADRTLMAIMRTSLSMIGFGFTIFSVFNSVAARELIGDIVPDRTPGLFGLALVVLGVLLLVAGIAADMRYMAKLRRQHHWLLESEWGGGIDPIDRSLIVMSAIALLLIGLVAIGVIVVRI